MQFSTIYTAAFAAMAFLALPTIGAPSPNIEARSAELDARANEILEARAAALVCQFGGVKACSAEVRLTPPDPPSHDTLDH